jgi:hypothetical protein
MAQDIEAKYPGFVFDMDGKKVVKDIDKFMPRDHRAAGGSSSSSSSSGSQASSGKANVYAPASADYATPAADASASSSLDPSMGQFLSSVFDPKTADQIARSRWVSQGSQTSTAPADSFGYFSQLAQGAASGGRIQKGPGGGFGELSHEVQPDPLGGGYKIGMNFVDPKPAPGSLGDVLSDTKMMFGMNPIDNPEGVMAFAKVPAAGMAPSNLPAQATADAKKMVPQPAQEVGKQKTAEGINKAKEGSAEAAKGKGGGGGGSSGGGGGGGAPKAPKARD